MTKQKSALHETLDALKNAPKDKKAIITEKLAPVLEDILKSVITFDSILKEFFEHVEPGMAAQIVAIDKRTEKSANLILDASERISTHIKPLPAAQKDPIQKEINLIFQACNFQDLVSQHANEIRLLLKDLTADMEYSKNVMSDTNKQGNVDFEAQRRQNKRPDAHLLNGPTTHVDEG